MTRRIDPSLIPEAPDLSIESALWQSGCLSIAGIDEAGRGCIAGPVAAAAVILPADPEIQHTLAGVRDSKIISHAARERLRAIIESAAAGWAVGFASADEIDRLGIVPATRTAIHRALQQLPDPDHLLIDYLVLPDHTLPQTRLVKGDARSLTIAAASILAKTHRDEQMIKLAGDNPGYGWESNKGYATGAHREAIAQLGPSPYHRMTFAPLRKSSPSPQQPNLL